MEATVNISLKELESLKKELVNLKAENYDLKKETEIKVVIDGDMYDWKSRNRVFNYRIRAFDRIDALRPDINWQEFQLTLDELFKKLLEQSHPVKFYNKFPQFVHRWFNCA